VNQICLEIPGGMMETGEDPCAAGARELAEETGYGGGTWRVLGKVAPNPAIQANALYTVLATVSSARRSQTPDDGEVLAVETATLAEWSAKSSCAARSITRLVVVAFAHLAFRSGELASITG